MGPLKEIYYYAAPTPEGGLAAVALRVTEGVAVADIVGEADRVPLEVADKP